MHPEFKAYVEAVCDTADGVQPARVNTHSGRDVKPVNAKRNFLKAISEFLAELPPYYCELKMVPGVKRIASQASRRRDAIGYHGLI